MCVANNILINPFHYKQANKSSNCRHGRANTHHLGHSNRFHARTPQCGRQNQSSSVTMVHRRMGTTGQYRCCRFCAWHQPNGHRTVLECQEKSSSHGRELSEAARAKNNTQQSKKGSRFNLVLKVSSFLLYNLKTNIYKINYLTVCAPYLTLSKQYFSFVVWPSPI